MPEWLTLTALTGVAILFTALSYLCGIYVVERKVRVAGSLLIGAVVVLTGYLMAILRAPLWVIVAAPVPLGFLLLLLQMKNAKRTTAAYFCTWGFYLVFHVLLSSVFRYDSLLPAWRLHS